MSWEWWAWGKKRRSEGKDVGEMGAQKKKKKGGELEGGEGEVGVSRDLPASGLQGDKS